MSASVATLSTASTAAARTAGLRSSRSFSIGGSITSTSEGMRREVSCCSDARRTVSSASAQRAASRPAIIVAICARRARHRGVVAARGHELTAHHM